MSKMSGEGSEVDSDQPEKEATEPYHGARPRATDCDRPVDFGLGATMGGLEEDVDLRDSEVPRLPPEKQIQQEEEVQTPPRRDLRRVEGHQPRGPRITTDELRLGQVDLADQQGDIAGRNRFLRTPRAPVPVPLVRQAALTTTKVPWFNGSTSWEQYQQVFDAIVLSNGWGDATAALQLLSHLQDDALSVALLVPMPLRASRRELTDALSSHYGSPGRLANYRREFDKTVRKRGVFKTLPISPLL